MNYIKEKLQEWKSTIIALVCLICSFMSGFGAGRGEALFAKPVSRQLHYTTNQSMEAKNEPTKNTNVAGTNDTKTANTTTVTEPADCYIKGSKSKLYHLPDGAFYDRTNPQQCFATEVEAQAAGYTKSSR